MSLTTLQTHLTRLLGLQPGTELRREQLKRFELTVRRSKSNKKDGYFDGSWIISIGCAELIQSNSFAVKHNCSCPTCALSVLGAQNALFVILVHSGLAAQPLYLEASGLGETPQLEVWRDHARSH